MILIRCDPEGYGMSSSTSTNIIHGGKKLKELCRKEGKRNARPDPNSGEPTHIYQYSMQHSDGICYLYVNETTNLTLEEEIEFKLEGLEIEGKPGETTAQVTVGPGQERFVKLRSISQPWRVATAISFGIY